MHTDGGGGKAFEDRGGASASGLGALVLILSIDLS